MEYGSLRRGGSGGGGGISGGGGGINGSGCDGDHDPSDLQVRKENVIIGT
ncbi:conserved hypothetical protein [Ricinus communis]|uniref:Uncharacterized protein n=1 Tax=Ricinus communis TaxID=3988 RepID=B9T0B6_RICCO|nr:conserved hypothetical protein [Ricinus communis]